MNGQQAAPERESERSRDDVLRLGGMALRNGLLIHGPTSWAAAARGSDGRIHAASGPKPVIAPGLAGRVPGVRGPLKLVEAFAVLPVVRRRLPAARLPFEDARVLGAMALTALASAAIRRRRPSTFAGEMAAAALGLLPAMVALRDSDLAAYHGVEHKAIGAYEHGSMDPADAAKEHERCGSNLVAPMMALTVGGQLLLHRLVERPSSAARAVVGLAAVSASVEMFAWSERHGDTDLAHAFHWPGTEIQRLIATREPTSDQLEVGSVALAEILRIEGAGAG
jgi:uncharacterized protein YqhQ